MTTSAESAARTVHVRITGLVQGVGYRMSCREAAIERGVGGWVRNRPDGSVEAIFHGPRPAVDALLAWCQAGPPAAQVNSVDASDASADDAASISRGSFEVR